MAYCIDKSLEKQRGNALKEIIIEHRSIAEVARRFGRSRSTIYRWKKKWTEQNQHIDLINHGRPTRMRGKVFRVSSIHWNIPTSSSAPLTHPNALEEDIVKHVIETKLEIKRSNYIVWLTLQNENINVSFSSVRRIIKRYRLQRVKLYGKKYWNKHNPRRPLPKQPGDLVEIDTVFLMNHFGGKDLFITNVIDVYSRTTYSSIDYSYNQLSSANTILKAEKYLGFKFKMVQCDNGREFGNYFRQVLNKNNIEVRHTRVRKPNDNAHIERFNRTMRDELIGPYTGKPLEIMKKNIEQYLVYYNYARIHTKLGMTPMEVLQRC